MRLRTSTIQARHLARRCVQCGCERPTSALAHQCVECGCDLVERPPRSYAEMEGLVEAAVARPEDPFVVWRRTAMLERWLLEDGDYVVGALGPDGPARLRADAQRWGERLQQRGRRLITNLFDQLDQV